MKKEAHHHKMIKHCEKMIAMEEKELEKIRHMYHKEDDKKHHKMEEPKKHHKMEHAKKKHHK